MSFVSDTHYGFTVKALSGLKLEQYMAAILTNLIDRDQDPKTATKFRIKAKASEIFDARTRTARYIPTAIPNP